MKGSSGRIPVSAPPILQSFEPGFTSTNGDVDGGSDDNDDFQVYGDDSVMAKLRDLVRETIKEVESERKASLKEAPLKQKKGVSLHSAIQTALMNSREGAMNPEEYVRRAVVEFYKNRIPAGVNGISKQSALSNLKLGLDAYAQEKYDELAPIVLKAVEDIEKGNID